MNATVCGAALLGLLSVLPAQQGRGQEVETLERSIQAALLEHVEGDASALLAELESQLQDASGEERADILIKLWVLRQRLGRLDEAGSTLQTLAELSGPQGDWARRLALVQDPPQREQDRRIPDQLRSLVSGLDAEDPGSIRELQKLGSLAIPAIVQSLEARELSLGGMRRALRLIIAYDDPRVAEALRSMLSSENPLLQIVAAEFVPQLADPARGELGRMALESPASIVRLRGVQAGVRAGQIDGRLREVAGGLLTDPSQEVRAQLASLLQDVSGDQLPADEWLARLAHDEDSRVFKEAIGIWLSRRSPGDDAQRISLFDSLNRWQQEDMLATEWGNGRGNGDLFLHAVGFPRYFGATLETVMDDRLAGAPDFLRAVLSGSDVSQKLRVLEIVQKHRVEELIPDVVPLLGDRDDSVRRSAFWTLNTLGPEPLLEHSAEMLEDDVLDDLAAYALATHGTAEHVPLMVEAIRPNTPYSGELMNALVARSEARHLEAVLSLVSVPQIVLSSNWDYRVTTVRNALRRWFTRESILPSLQRVRMVDRDVAVEILDLARQYVTAGEVPAIIRLLETMREEASLPESGPAIDRQRVPLARSEIALGCIGILGAAGGERAVETLRSLMTDEQLGEKAFETLLAMEGAPHRELLAQALAEEAPEFLVKPALAHPLAAEDEELRAAAERRLLAWTSKKYSSADVWLDRLPEEERRRICIEITTRRHASEEVAWIAMQRLGDERDASLVSTLAIGLSHPDTDVREAAVVALQKTFSKDAAPHLIEALKDDDSGVLAAAKTALARLSDYFDEKEKWEQKLGIKKDR